MHICQGCILECMQCHFLASRLKVLNLRQFMVFQTNVLKPLPISEPNGKCGVVGVFGKARKVIIRRNGSWWIRVGWKDGIPYTCDGGNKSDGKGFSLPFIFQ